MITFLMFNEDKVYSYFYLLYRRISDLKLLIALTIVNKYLSIECIFEFSLTFSLICGCEQHIQTVLDV